MSMDLTETELRKRAEEHELLESQKFHFTPDLIPSLEALLLDVYASLHPARIEYDHRRNLVKIFDLMVKQACAGRGDFPSVEAFGSFTMDMFTSKSDLDLSLNFGAEETVVFPRDKKIFVLRILSRVKWARSSSIPKKPPLVTVKGKGKVSGVLPILRARVPVLKVVHCGTGIECDISVENRDGISRSLIINLMCMVDERFRILSFLMKVWAKAHDINSTKDHTFSSLSIILLVAFHLQTRDPPILPPFSAILRDGPCPVSVENVVHGFKDFGKANKESVAELFIALLVKLSSVRSLWERGLCASSYEGFWILKTWEAHTVISVEDFSDRSQNCTRAVGKSELPKIYSSIDSSIVQLANFLNGQVEGSDLKLLLFGPVSLHNRDESVVPSGPKTSKRKRKQRNHEVTAPGNANKMYDTGITGQPLSPDIWDGNAIHSGSQIPKKGKKIESVELVAASACKATQMTPLAASDGNQTQVTSVAEIDGKKTQMTSIAASDSKKAQTTSVGMTQKTGRSQQLLTQTPSFTTVHKGSVPLYRATIPWPTSYKAEDQLNPPELFTVRYHQPQQLPLPVALPGQHLSPFQLGNLGCSCQNCLALSASSVAYRPVHYPPFVPLGLQGGQQMQPLTVTSDTHNRSFHNMQSSLGPLGHFPSPGLGSHPVYSMPSVDGHSSPHLVYPRPSVDGRQNVQFGYNNQRQSRLPARPFYRG